MTKEGEEEGGAYEYDAHDPDNASLGDYYTGDQCPACGEALTGGTEVMNESGEKGEVLELAEEDVSIPLWHPECWREHSDEIRGLGNEDLTDY